MVQQILPARFQMQCSNAYFQSKGDHIPYIDDGHVYRETSNTLIRRISKKQTVTFGICRRVQLHLTMSKSRHMPVVKTTSVDS